VTAGAATAERHGVPVCEVILAPPEVEVLLALPEPEAPTRGRVKAAIDAIDALDPLRPRPSPDDPYGTLVLRGRVSLMPLTLGAMLCSVIGFSAAILFCTTYAPQYMLAFAVLQAVFLIQIWYYHVGYRTQRRFLAARQAIFLALLVTFIDWMLYDLITKPPGDYGGSAPFLWIAIGANTGIAIIINVHWLILGRGQRVRPLTRFAPAARPAVTADDTDAPKTFVS